MINPYNFVRADKPMPRGAPYGHDRFQGQSGTLVCRVEVVTPIFTPAFGLRAPGAAADLRFFRLNDRPALPGSGSAPGPARSPADCRSASPL